jgi:hypothetical protein
MALRLRSGGSFSGNWTYGASKILKQVLDVQSGFPRRWKFWMGSENKRDTTERDYR